MEFDLQPLTEPGKRMVALAENHAEDFATRVSQHDRDGTFAVENVEAMKKSGLSAGEWIVVAGVHSAREGQRVRILDVETGEEIQP